MSNQSKKNDRDRLTFIAGLIKACPTASFHYNDDPDVHFPDGTALMPVGFTIRVEGVCDPVRATAPTFRKCVDSLREKMKTDQT